jgi:hypothetical protein
MIMMDQEAFAIDPEPSFVCLVHERTKDAGQNTGGQIWFEHASPKDATHSDTYARTMSRPAAKQLIDKLEALG